MESRFKLDDMWEEHEDYWVNLHKQGTKKWKAERKSLLTGSNFGIAAGHSPYERPDEYLARWSQGKEINFSQRSLDHLERGTRLEPIVRTFYEIKKEVKVVEVGLIVPRWNTNIGVSLDGLVGDDGCIEIKCPQEMYPNLVRTDLPQKLRIPPYHYDQMQGGMAVASRSWCDYIVYCEKRGQIHIERVYFDPDYWNRVLYPALQEFLAKGENLNQVKV